MKIKYAYSLLLLIITLETTSHLYAMHNNTQYIDIIEAKVKKLTLGPYRNKKKTQHVIIVVPPINHQTNTLYASFLKQLGHKKNMQITRFKPLIKSFNASLSYTANSLYSPSLIKNGLELAEKITEIKKLQPQAIISIIGQKDGCLIVSIASQLLNLFDNFKERKDNRRKSLYLKYIKGFKKLSKQRKSDSFILKKLKSKIWLYEKWYYMKTKDIQLENTFKETFRKAKKSSFGRITQNFRLSKYKTAKRYSTGFSMSAQKTGYENYFINTFYMLNPPTIMSTLETKEYYFPHDKVIERCIHFWSKENRLFKEYFGSSEVFNPSLFDQTSIKVRLQKPSLRQLLTKNFKKKSDIENYFAHYFFTITQLIHQTHYYYPHATLKIARDGQKKPSLKISLKSTKQQ